MLEHFGNKFFLVADILSEECFDILDFVLGSLTSGEIRLEGGNPGLEFCNGSGNVFVFKICNNSVDISEIGVEVINAGCDL